MRMSSTSPVSGGHQATTGGPVGSAQGPGAYPAEMPAPGPPPSLQGLSADRPMLENYLPYIPDPPRAAPLGGVFAVDR